jgi:hypothetical protein
MKKINLLLIVLFFASLFLFNACTIRKPAVNYTSYDKEVFKSKPDDFNIEIFRSTLPTKPYIEMGIIKADGGGKVTAFKKPDLYTGSLELLKKEARKQGGDAVIDLREAVTKEGFTTLTGTLIRWK